MEADTAKTKQQLLEEVQTLRQQVADLEKAETALRQVQQALKESETHYQSLYNKTPIMVHSIDRDGKLTNVSDRWLQVLGYERDEVIGRRSIEFLSESSRQAVLAIHLPNFYATGYVKDIELEFVKKNGEVIDVLLPAVAERDESGEFFYSLAVLIDVTERKRSEEELRKKSEIFRNAHWGMAISTAGGTLDIVNPVFARMHGYSVAELTGRPVAEVYAPEVRSELPARLRAIERTGHLTWETKHVRKDGSTFPVLMDVHGVNDAQGNLCYRVANVIDISERKQAEEALKESEERYRSLYVKTPVMLHSTDATGKLISVSDYWLDTLFLQETVQTECVSILSIDNLCKQRRFLFSKGPRSVVV